MAKLLSLHIPVALRRDWDNALWLTVAIGLMYWWEVPSTFFGSDKVIVWSFHLSLVAYAVFTTIGAYFVLYCHGFWHIPANEWHNKRPQLFPIASVAFIVSCVAFIHSTWPVWGVVGIPIVLSITVAIIILVGFI